MLDIPAVAPIVTVRFEVTAAVFAVKLAVVPLRDTVTEAGTVSDEVSLLDKDTAVPFPAAALASVTVQVVVEEAVRVVLAHCNEIGGSVTAIVSVFFELFKTDVMVALWFEVTGAAVAVKLAVVAA